MVTPRQNGRAPRQETGRRFPIGYKFHPTPQEVIQLFLFKKLMGLELEILTDMIMELDVYRFDPDQLPMDSSSLSRTNEGYYFAPSENRNWQRRETPTGYWQIIKENVPVLNRDDEVVGFKNRLSFYSNGTLTDWRMSEYRCNLDGNDTVEEKYIVCKVRFKVNEDETDSSADSEEQQEG